MNNSKGTSCLVEAMNYMYKKCLKIIDEFFLFMPLSYYQPLIDSNHQKWLFESIILLLERKDGLESKYAVENSLHRRQWGG